MSLDNTCFISGHTDLTQKEWDEHYKEKIDKAIESGCNFIVGDSNGTDAMSLHYLKHKKVSNVLICHMLDEPRNNPGFCCKGGFKSDTERDEFMTSASGLDIAWVRPEEECKKLYGKKWKPRISGTELNIIRRMNYND